MKKTKAEKRLADLRRVLELERAGKTLEYKPVLPTEDGKQNTIITQPHNQSIYIYPVQLIRKDLTKTFLLCILAISLELGLYFLLEKPGLLPF